MSDKSFYIFKLEVQVLTGIKSENKHDIVYIYCNKAKSNSKHVYIVWSMVFEVFVTILYVVTKTSNTVLQTTFVLKKNYIYYCFIVVRYLFLVNYQYLIKYRHIMDTLFLVIFICKTRNCFKMIKVNASGTKVKGLNLKNFQTEHSSLRQLPRRCFSVQSNLRRHKVHLKTSCVYSQAHF